jgi:hypothetical protein
MAALAGRAAGAVVAVESAAFVGAAPAAGCVVVIAILCVTVAAIFTIVAAAAASASLCNSCGARSCSGCSVAAEKCVLSALSMQLQMWLIAAMQQVGHDTGMPTRHAVATDTSPADATPTSQCACALTFFLAR